MQCTQITPIEYQNSQPFCSLSQLISFGLDHERIWNAHLARQSWSRSQAHSFPSLDAAATDVGVGGKHDDITQNTMNTSRTGFISYLTLGALLILRFGAPASVAQEQTGGGVQQMMSPEEFRARSEERRVGKECRSGWWQCYYKRK